MTRHGLLPRAFRWISRPLVKIGASVAGTFRRWFLSGQSTRGIGPMVAGMTVNEDTALTLPAYFAVIRVLSQTVAMLPRSVYVRQRRGRVKLWSHPVSKLLNDPCPAMIPMAWYETMTAWALSGGYGRALIIRDPRTNEPLEMWPIEPWRIELRWVGGRMWYFWRTDPHQDGTSDVKVLDPSEVFDLHGLGPDGTCGYSLIGAGAKAIGQGLARQEYASSFFGNGVWGSGFVTVPAPLSDRAFSRMNESLKEQWAGPTNAFKPLLFEEGAQWQTLAIPNKDAQLIESGQFNVLEICRVAGVPPHKVFALERMIYNNIESMQIEWRQDGVMPWTTRIDQESQRKLLPGGMRGPLYVRHNLDGLQRGDYATRMEGHQKAITGGWKKPNEVREQEEMDAVGPEGDELYIQGAMKRLSDVHEPPEPAPAPPQAPPVPPPPAEDDEEDADAAALLEAVRPAFDAAAAQVARLERNVLSAQLNKHGGDQNHVIRWAEQWYPGQRWRIEGAFEAPLACASRIAATTGSSAGLTVDLVPILDEWQRDGIGRAESGDGFDEAAVVAWLSGSVYQAAVKAAEEATSCET